MQQNDKTNSTGSKNTTQTDKSSLFDHPLGFWFFFWGEFAERCSYYGMRAILLLYMVDRLDFSDQVANRIQSRLSIVAEK